MSQRDWLDKDFYAVLGVSKTATKDEIKRAYRKLAQQYHPDANKGDKDAEQRFKQIAEAHSVLSNDDKRAEYDRLRTFAESGGQRFFGFRPGAGEGNVRVTIGDLFDEEGGIGDLFGDVFGFGVRRPRKGRDVETEVELDLMDVVEGTTVRVNGAAVRVPPGLGDGGRFKVAARGEQSPSGGPPGDLFVRIRVRPHPVFTLGRGGDLIVKLPVTYAEAVLGAAVEVPTLDGSVVVKVPPGTQHNTTLRVRGKGAGRGDGSRGDLLAKVELVVPSRLSKKEKEALEAFARVHDESPRAHFEEQLKKTGRRAS